MKDVLIYKDYIASIELDACENYFTGKVVAINADISFKGCSLVELKKAFFKAVDDYLDECYLLQRIPDKPYLGGFNITVSPEMHRMVSIACAYKNMTQDDFVRHAIEYTLLHSEDRLGQFVKN